MNTVRSADGTTITCTRAGQGPPLILVDGALPDATYRTLRGQNHMIKPQAIAPVLTEFFAAND